jgi:hypothetical protein
VTQEGSKRINRAEHTNPFVVSDRLLILDKRLRPAQRASNGIEHARLHGGFRDADDLRNFTYRFFMIVNQVDYLTLRRLQGGHALAEKSTCILLLQRDLRVIGRVWECAHDLVIQVYFNPATHRG